MRSIQTVNEAWRDAVAALPLVDRRGRLGQLTLNFADGMTLPVS